MATLIAGQRRPLFANAMMVAVRAENTAIALKGTESGAATGTRVEDQSGIQGNVQLVDKAALRAG